MLSVLGCYDDLCDMRADLKLLGQVLSAVPLILARCYAERLILFGQTIELGWLGIPWTIGWIVLGINALNLIDGMDGWRRRRESSWPWPLLQSPRSPVISTRC